MSCRKRHADVLEWLFFLNSHAELLYKHMLGDKDTFEIAFMLAGKHSQFHRVPISPGVPLSKMYKNIHQGSWRQRFMKKARHSTQLWNLRTQKLDKALFQQISQACKASSAQSCLMAGEAAKTLQLKNVGDSDFLKAFALTVY